VSQCAQCVAVCCGENINTQGFLSFVMSCPLDLLMCTQCVVGCCSVLQCVAVCCSVSQCAQGVQGVAVRM